MKRLGVVAALEAEARAFRSLGKRDRSPGDGGSFSVLNDGSLLAVSGIGFAAASAAASALATAPVSALMTFGLAGGLDPTLESGTVVLPDQVISTSGRSFCHLPLMVRAACRRRSIQRIGQSVESYFEQRIAARQPLEKKSGI